MRLCDCYRMFEANKTRKNIVWFIIDAHDYIIKSSY